MKMRDTGVPSLPVSPPILLAGEEERTMALGSEKESLTERIKRHTTPVPGGRVSSVGRDRRSYFRAAVDIFQVAPGHNAPAARTAYVMAHAEPVAPSQRIEPTSRPPRWPVGPSQPDDSPPIHRRCRAGEMARDGTWGATAVTSRRRSPRGGFSVARQDRRRSSSAGNAPAGPASG